MGIDYDANLCYGIKLSNEKDKDLIEKILNEGFENDSLFDIVYSGDSYVDEGIEIIIAIKESRVNSNTWELTPLLQNCLEPKEWWFTALCYWAQQNNLKDPKIGWWLSWNVC